MVTVENLPGAPGALTPPLYTYAWPGGAAEQSI